MYAAPARLVVAVLGASALVGALAACTTTTPTSPSTQTSVVTTSAGASTGPTTSRSTTGPTGSTPVTTASPSAQVVVPVYYIAEPDPKAGPRLYREFRSVSPHPAGPIGAAVTAMLSLPPLDPDYANGWSGVSLRSVHRAADVVTVDLSGWGGWGAAYEGAAVQQLVYTVTAADTSVTGVRITVNGAAPPSGHLDLRGVQRRGNALSTVGLVWILTPQQGATSGSPVTVTVYGTGFEGHTPLKVFRGGTEVASTFVTTAMGSFAEASTTITLPPGDYELRAYTDNAENGTLRLWDTKAFTVR
ncbi:MAG TPA: GerMN domain-containing protein [Dermatophilaceae bacterium]|nr:GerMN domain-containing protein [Dermatophilaceae bacterium]